MTLVLLIISIILKSKKKRIKDEIEEVTEELIEINSGEEVIPLYNSNLDLLPTLIFHFDYDGPINEDLYDKLKEEISEIIDKNDFAIIEIQRGSAIPKIALIGDLAKQGIKASKQKEISNEILGVIKKLEEKEFVCFGNNSSSYTKYNIPDYSKAENREKLVKFLKEESRNNEDIIQAVSTIKDEEFDNILENIENISNTIIKQEINQKKFMLYNLEEFNNQLELILDKSKQESIIEFGVVGLSLIDRNKIDYEREKNNCFNVKTKFLFHGTSTDISSKITITNFIKANTAFFGPGIYMTDMLDYAGFYSFESGNKFNNHHKIRAVNETFCIVASQIYYDNSKFENCYKKTRDIIQEKGIRYICVDAYGRPLSKDQTKENGYNKFIGTEFVIPNEKQILPLYSITLKRNEYYCLWKDYHFTHETSFTKHALHVKNVAKQLLGINVYGVGEFGEALDIIKRKKYNKVILLSNVGDDVKKVKDFINEVRAILKFNVIVLFFTSSINHLKWIKDFPNALFTTKDDFFKEYILNFNENGLNNLKLIIEEEYGEKLNNFHADLSYPLFEEVENNNDYDSINID